MKTKIILGRIFMALILLSPISGCQKNGDEDKELKTYTIQLENAAVKDTKCGVDLINGIAYTISEGSTRQEDIDIAYGYMVNGSGDLYERCFLSISYAGCWCGGSSYFSYGDQIGADGTGTRRGYGSYSVQNDTKIAMSNSAVDFDNIFVKGKQFDLDAAFAEISTDAFKDQAFFSSSDDLVQYPYVFFRTIKGKKGIMRIKGYIKDIQIGYQLHNNPISIDVVVEK